MLAPAPTRRLLLGTAIFGVLAGALVRLGTGSGSTQLSSVLTLAVLAVVPLALAAAPSAGPSWDRLLRVASWALIPLALCAVISLWAPTGLIGGGWASAWMAFALLVAMLGLGRLFSPGAMKDPRSLSVAGALALLPVGAAWLVMSRMGLRPLGFDPLIVLLTAVHFHFAALSVPVLAARASGALEGRARQLTGLAGVGAVVAMPIVAAGITGSAALALVGAVLLALCVLLVAAFTLARVLRGMKSRWAKLLLGISALSAVLSMPLAVVYAWGQVSGTEPISMQWMIRLHGYANAHGFATCGLLAWVLEDRAADG